MSTYGEITRDILNKADKASFNNLGTIFGLVLVLFVIIVYIREWYKYSEEIETPPGWLGIILLLLGAVLGAQIFFVYDNSTNTIQKDTNRKKDLSLRLSEIDQTIRALQNNIKDAKLGCYDVNKIENQNAIPDITADGIADCLESTSSRITKINCEKMSSCILGENCTNDLSDPDFCIYTVPNPQGEKICSNVCGPGANKQWEDNITTLQQEKKKLEAELKQIQSRIDDNATTLASNSITIGLSLIVVITFLILSRKSGSITYWEAGWFGTLLLLALVGGSMSSYILSQVKK